MNGLSADGSEQRARELNSEASAKQIGSHVLIDAVSICPENHLHHRMTIANRKKSPICNPRRQFIFKVNFEPIANRFDVA